jgi:AraC-like DNA-binding protein
MGFNAIDYFAFLLLSLAIILFFDILYKFKRPLILRYLFLMISIGFLWKGVGYFYFLNFFYNRWLIEFPNTILASCLILILAHLKDQKIKLIYIFYCVLIIITQFSILFYLSFIAQLPLYIPSMQVAVNIKTIRIIYSISTISICIYLIFKIFSALKQTNDYIAKLKNWYFILSFIFIVSAFAFTSIDFSSSANNFPLLLNICMNILYIIAILYRPNFINNSNIKLKANTSFNIKELDNMDDAIFINHFFYQKYYLKMDANMEDFAETVGFKPEVIRKHITTNYQLSFIELINKNRVLAFLELVKSDKVKNYTIEGIAKECGFSSRFHLYNNFKKFHGGTPGDYIKTIQG